VESVIVDLPITQTGDYVVEPCTGVGPVIEGFDPDQIVNYNYYDILDEEGHKVPFTLLEREEVQLEVERKLDSNAAIYNLNRNRILMEVDVPPMGYRTYALRPRKRKYITKPKPGKDRLLIANSEGILQNEFLRVSINPNGTFNITDIKAGREFKNIHYFCDDGSTGTAHNHKVPLRDYMVTSLGNNAELTLLENNSLRATWQIDMTMSIPASAYLDGTNRSEYKVKLPITTWLTLKKGSKRLEIKTRITNTARDHRLRVMFPTNIKTDHAYAGGAFDVLKRQIQWIDTGDNMESHYPFKPMRDFVTVSNEDYGFSFISKGLNEYEVIDDSCRTLAVTLMRTHRAYMLANRGAKTFEEYQKQQGQHCLETINFEYAIYIHKSNWELANVNQQALDYKVPQRIVQGVPKRGDLLPSQSLITVSANDYLQFSALYKSQNHEGYILRLWNSSNKLVDTDINFAFPIKAAAKLKLDETFIENIELNYNQIKLCVGPRKIKTILLTL
jgi:alpha-mannosidase